LARESDRNQNGLSGQLLGVLEKAAGNDMELGTVVATLSRQSHSVLLVFLSFPLCIPIGIPLFSTTLGLMLGLVGYLLLIDRSIWIPKSFAAKLIPYSALSRVIGKLLRVSRWAERFFHPRMPFFVKDRRMLRMHGFFVLVLGLAAAVPLPLPFNNLVAALPILLLGFSLLENDGLLVIVSYLASIPFFIYYSALIYLGHAGFERLMGF
jgi:hypothetical protein